jgi:hypothetical protein
VNRRKTIPAELVDRQVFETWAIQVPATFAETFVEDDPYWHAWDAVRSVSLTGVLVLRWQFTVIDSDPPNGFRLDADACRLLRRAIRGAVGATSLAPNLEGGPGGPPSYVIAFDGRLSAWHYQRRFEGRCRRSTLRTRAASKAAGPRAGSAAVRSLPARGRRGVAVTGIAQSAGLQRWQVRAHEIRNLKPRS